MFRRFFTEIRTARVSFSQLRRHLGFRRALSVGFQASRRGDPFAGLEESGDQKDIQSRKQIEPAVNLYLELCSRVEREEALRVAGDVIRVASIVFLESLMGGLDPVRLRKMNPADRIREITAITDRFPNADGEIVDISTEGFVHRVTFCRFVKLCTDIGLPELAPLFCRGDVAFFERGPLALDRPTTLAEGGTSCEFRFRLRNTRD